MHFREAREACGMSQKYVALTLGVKPPNVSRWEAGVTFPTVENLIALAKLYGVSTDYLLGLDSVPIQAAARGVASYDEAILVQCFRGMGETGRAAVLATAEALARQDETKQEPPASAM